MLRTYRIQEIPTPRNPGQTKVSIKPRALHRDLTALVVGHAETRDAGRVVVIDRVLSWKPEPGQRVDLTEVEAAARRICKGYRARLRFDRMQAEQLTGNLTRSGLRTDEYIFSAAGASRLARSLATALRDRALELPDDEETRREFITTRLVETGPGTVKLQNPPGAHDDIVTAVGMVVTDLMARPETGRGSVMVPQGRMVKRDLSALGPRAARSAAHPPRPIRQNAAAALLRGPRMQRRG